MAEKVKKAVKPGMPGEKVAKEAAKATLLALTKTDDQKAAAVKAPAALAIKTPSGAAVKVEEKPVMIAPKVEAAKAPSSKPAPKSEAAKNEPVKPAAKSDVPKAEAIKAETAKAPSPKPAPKSEAAKSEPVKPAAKTDAPKAETTKAETAKAPIPKSDAPKSEAVKAEPAKTAASEEAPKAESKKEADPGKEFVDGIMTEMALKGGSKKRLIKMLAEQFNFDRQKVMFRLKRALITERYAAAHAEASGH